MPPPPPPESGEPAGDDVLQKAECLRLLDALPAAAAASPAFRRHWPSISASLASLSASLSHPAFPPSAPRLLAPLASALSALVSVAGNGAASSLGHLHTVSLLSSSAAELSQLAADARLLVSPGNGGGEGEVAGAGADWLIPRLRLGSAASRAAALDALVDSVGSLPPSSAAAAVSAVAAMLDSGEILPASREKAVSVLAAFASSDATCRLLAQEAGAVVPHLCRALESGGAGAEQACVALRPLTADSRDAAAAVAARGGVAALLGACAAGTPAAQAAAAGVLRNLAAFPDLLPTFREEGALPSLIQLVSLGTPRAQELALGCLQNLTSGDGDECQRLKVEAFQDGALGCVKDFLESCVGDEPGLAPAFGLLRNMASFRYIAEIAVSASFVDHVLAALGSDRAATRTEAAMALAELCNLLDPSTARGGVDARFPVSVLLAVSPSRRCRKQMVAAGACGFLQGLLAAEVDGAKKLADCLARGKMLGVFPRS
uniref:Armadillo repeat-containing domain-containing protein n=1 Tax=Oryza meridionalis TaxID=40149 RepID=A0A0E0F642_9ORYZ